MRRNIYLAVEISANVHKKSMIIRTMLSLAFYSIQTILLAKISLLVNQINLKALALSVYTCSTSFHII